MRIFGWSKSRRLALMTAIVCMPLPMLAVATGAETKPPNIVFILADDLGWADVHCFDPQKRGYYETPHIDRLAAQGMKFTQGYANGANCSPTRAALLSGQYYPHQPIYHVGSPSRGKLIPAENGRFLPTDKITLAEALKRGIPHRLHRQMAHRRPARARATAARVRSEYRRVSGGKPRRVEGRLHAAEQQSLHR